MAWISLVVAGLCEMFGVSMMNRLNQRKDWQSLMLLIAGFAASFLFLTIAMEKLPMGTAYAIWTGIGVVGGAVIGMIFYGEKRDWRRLLFITLVLGAAVGLKLAG